MNIPAYFAESYQAFESYPQIPDRLVTRASHLGSFNVQSRRFHIAGPTLFVSESGDIDVKFRDFNEAGRAPERENVSEDRMLRDWLGDQSTVGTPGHTLVGSIATKVDPKCRFIFLWAGMSRAPLKITKQMFLRICTYHQVMPAFLEFVCIFGLQSGPVKLRISGYREHIAFQNPAINSITDLRRSGRQFQLCYNLQSVICKTGQATPLEFDQWSIRPAAVYHQFDITFGTTLWIITKGNLELQKRVKQMTGAQGRPEDRSFGSLSECFRSTLGVHLMLTQFSAEQWRAYIKWLEDVTDRYADKVLSDLFAPDEIMPEDLQKIQGYDDKANEAIMVMAANSEVVTSLYTFYENLINNTGFEIRTECQQDIEVFLTRIKEVGEEIELQMKNAKRVAKIIGDLKTLTLQLLQSKSTIKMERLTISMHEISKMSQREAIIMRIITVAALLYLPATFTSSFFSTDIVKYQDLPDDGSASFSHTAMNRWLQVTFPLTAVTLAIAGWWYYKEEKRRKEKQQRLESGEFDDEARQEV